MGRRLHQAGAVLLLFLTSSVIYSADHVSAKAPPCDPWAAKIASVQGQVEARRSSTTDWQPVALNEIYCPGDQIRVGDNARAAVVLNNETLVRLSQNSAITLAEIKTDGPSLLELLKGIAHFISRVPRSLKVNTPFVNAAIEGTEFVVAIGNQQTEVTVFEGIVLTQNQHGEMRITQNETAVAKAGGAPQKVLKATPRDAVQWALYFPPVFDQATGKPAIAQQQLYTGQIDAARETLKNDDSAEALSLRTIIAIVQNDADGALKTAQQAVEKNPHLAAAHIALSYAQQSKRDLAGALNSAKQATMVESRNAIAWARVAELQLSTGDLSNALDAAKRATELNPNLARTQTILGFAYLLQVDIDEAKTAFNKAIELDQVDPLPRLGLGLTKIRKNELADGRRDIEIAASLDPNNAIIRSYLGKAYFEEKRAPLDAEQFAMAKELDPNDPTPWFYDAIRKQTENDPVGALADLNKSIELNNNRAVYRSSLQLDQDEAARGASLAKIYQDLGYEVAAVNEATKSLANDPTNHSAHRLLADVYSTRQRHEIAHASELFQSKMLQPLGLNVLQPQASFSDLDTLSYGNNFGNSASDFSNLYTHDSLAASANFFVGNNNTMGDELMVAGLYNNFAISAAQYAYQSDGFRDNNDIDHEIYNLFMQAQITNKLTLQYEFIDRNTNKGDLSLNYDPSNFADNVRTDIDTAQNRIGVKYSAAPNHTFLANSTYVDINDIQTTITSIVFPIVVTQITTLDTHLTERGNELQYIYHGSMFNAVTGVSHINHNNDLATSVRVIDPFTDTTTTTPSNFDSDYESIYSYINWQTTEDLLLDLGLSYENYERLDASINRLNPKFGMLIKASDSITFRAASFSSVNKPFSSNQSLEPTNVTGFNQFFADLQGSKITQHGVAIDFDISSNFKISTSTSYRDIDAPIITTGSTTFDQLIEKTSRFDLQWIPSRLTSISLSAIYEKFENVDAVILNTPKELKTLSYPVNISAFLPGRFKVTLLPTYIDHDYVDASNNKNHDSFIITDLSMAYIFPKRQGSFSIGINNVFDEQFNFYNLNYTGENNEPRFLPSRSFITKLSLTLQ